MTEENMALRNLLWSYHRCNKEHNILYGDDGEMQCNGIDHIIDFKRDTPEEIEYKIIVGVILIPPA